jgi:hypothetical protein
MAIRVCGIGVEVRALAAILLLVCSACVEAAPKTKGVRIEATVNADNNVSRAPEEVDQFDDQFATLDLRKRFKFSPSPNTRLRITPQIAGARFANFDGLSNVYGGAEIDLLYRSSGSLSALTYRAFARAAYHDFESQLRDGSRYSVGGSAQKYIGDRAILKGEIAYNARDSRSEVFDLRDWSANLYFDYAISTRGAFYAGGEYRDGDVFSTAQPSIPVIAIADAIAVDDVFTDITRFAYRFEARSVYAVLGFNYAIGAKHGLDISVRGATAKAKEEFSNPLLDQDSEYDFVQLSIAYLYRF